MTRGEILICVVCAGIVALAIGLEIRDRRDRRRRV